MHGETLTPGLFRNPFPQILVLFVYVPSKEETFVMASKAKALSPSPLVPEAIPLTGEVEVVSTRPSSAPSYL